KMTDLVVAYIIPIPGIGRVKVTPGPRERERLCFILRRFCTGRLVKQPPFLAVAGGHQRMVVFQKIPVRDQDLPYIEDSLDFFYQRKSGLFIVHPDDFTADQPYGRSFDGIYGYDTAGLARAFEFHLCTDRKKSPQQVERRRVEPGSRKAGIAGAAVPEPEAPFPHRVGKDRPSTDEIPEVLVQRFYAGGILFRTRFCRAGDELVQPVPVVHVHLLDLALE